MPKKIKTFNKPKTLIIFTLFLLVFFVTPHITSAINLNIDYPAIPYPGGSISLNCIETGECTMTVGNILIYIYIVSIWIGGIIAVLTLFYVGFIFIYSGNNPGARTKAKKRFQDVLMGLAILFTAVIVLNVINPDITNLRDSSLSNIIDPDPTFVFGETENSGPALGYGTDIEGCLRNEEYDILTLQQCTNNCIDSSGGATVCMPIAAEATIKLCIEINGENEGICLLTNCIQWLDLSGVDPSDECSTAWADAIGASSPEVPANFIATLENTCVTGIDGLPASCTVKNTSSNSVTCRVPSISNDTACYENFRNTCNSYGNGNETSLTDVSCGNGVNDCVLNTCIYTGV